MFLSWSFSTRLKIKYEMYITIQIIVIIPSVWETQKGSRGSTCYMKFMNHHLGNISMILYLWHSYCDDSKCQKWHTIIGPVINRITPGKYLIRSLQNFFDSSIFETLTSGIIKPTYVQFLKIELMKKSSFLSS